MKQFSKVGGRCANRYLSVLCLALSVALLWGASAGAARGQMRGGGGTFTQQNGVTLGESDAFDAFTKEADVDAKIKLGEEFNLKYPKSAYETRVDDQLVYLYYNRLNMDKFYATADRLIAHDPNNLPVLRLVGWVISHNYDPHDAAGPAKLDKAEKYEKRALSIVDTRKQSKAATDEDFTQQRTSDELQAHDALAMIYLRRKDYDNSVKEFLVTVSEEGEQPDPADLYTMGVALQELGRAADAVDAFTKCAAISGDLQAGCKRAAARPEEEAAYQAINNEASVDTEIRLAEDFESKYPASPYAENVESTLVSLYYAKQDWSHFYASSDKVVARDPDNVPVLMLVGWVIPRQYDSQDPGGPAKLAESQKYEEHALELIAAMQQSMNVTGDQFNQAKSGAASEAHSGLGMMYFRRKDYANSAKELQAALKLTPDADSYDYYILGIDLHNLNRPKEASAAFLKCSQMPGDMRAQCKRDADASAKQATIAPGAIGTSAAPSAPAIPEPAPAEAPAPVSAQPPVAPAAAAQLTPASTGAPALNVPPPPAPDVPALTVPTAATVLKTETVLVPVRVVVRDRKGQPIANLTRDNFKIYEDGKEQQIAQFNAITLPPPALAAAAAPASGKASGRSAGSNSTAAAVTPATAPARFVALFFDDVHLYFGDVARARNQAEKYIGTLPTDERVAIVTASSDSSLEFTSDRAKLHERLQRVAMHPFPGGPGATGGLFNCPAPMTYMEADAIINGGASADPILATAASDIQVCMKTQGDMTGLARGFAENTNIAGEEATDSVFNSLENVVRRLAVLPGSRNIVLVSPGFVYRDRNSRFTDITTLAIHSNVVINTLDALAIYTPLEMGKWYPDRFMRYGYNHALEDGVLEDMAASTGGIFIHFNNDLAGAMREMSEPAEAYYMLAFAPPDLPADGKYHSLKVNLIGKSNFMNSVQARRGFFAPNHAETSADAAKREINDALFSVDEERDIPIKTETQLTADASGTHKLTVKANVDVSRLTFQKSGDANQENVTILAALFDNNGNYVTGTQKDAEMNFDDSTLAQLTKTGFYVNIDFDVKPGDYTLRVVARDANEGRLSAQDSPVSVPN